MKASLCPALLCALLTAAASFPHTSLAQSRPNRPRIALPPQAAPSSRPATPAVPAPPPVTWQSTTTYLTPETTVELRFPSAMVESWGNSLAVEADGGPAPLTISPPLRGTWTWRSSESGVFVPGEEPVRARTYTFAVREGLVDATGRPLALPQPVLSLKSASLALVEYHPRWFPSNNAPRSPQVFLQFNDRVNAATAAKMLRFTDNTGRQIPSLVRAATYGDLPLGYELRLQFREKALAVAGAPDIGTAPAPSLNLPGTLIVAPSEPLPVGAGWKLAVGKVPSADGKSAVEEARSVNIGDVEPLKVGYSSATHEVGTPKTIVLRFNKDLAPTITAEEILARVSLSPLPSEFKATYEQQWLRLTGAFNHETTYRVTINPGLKAADGLTMTSAHTEEFVFKVLSPAVALPAFSVNQLSKGRALFDVHSVNLRGVKVRVKVADRDSLIYALRAYRHFVNPHHGEAEGEDGDQAETRIPFDAMPGQKIFEQEFTATAPLDDQDEFVVDWRQALNGRKAGALFITVEGEARPEWPGQERRFGAQAFVQLTDIGLAWKLTAEDAFVSVFSQATGQPMPGATLIAYDTEKIELARTTTAEDGTARLPRGRATWLLAETPDDLHAIELDGVGSEGLGMWRFGVPYEWDRPRPTRRQVSLFTERPVYLPGHTVYFKAVSRIIDANGVKLPAGPEKAVLKAYDSQNRLFHERDVQFSAAGSLDGTLDLPAGGLGHYRLNLVMPDAAAADADEAPETADGEVEDDGDGSRDDVFRTSFLVEEYKPNTFQIAFDDASFKLDGEKAALSLQSSYLLGKPLNKARLAWTANVSGGQFSPPAFPDFEFLDSRQTYYWDEEGYHDVPDNGSETDLVTAQARTDLSEEGRATLDFTVPQAPFVNRPRSVAVTAEVTDLNQQTITERWLKTLHPSAFYLGIGRLDNLSGAGQPVDVTLAAARSDGEPWPDPVEAHITVEKVSFVSVRIQTVGGGSNVKTEAQRGVVAEGTVVVEPKGRDSRAFTWSPRDPGFYYITARAVDPSGQAVESVTSLQVSGEGWATWEERDGVRIDLSADKTSYEEGETASILVKSPVTGRALVTVERRGVMRHFFTDLKSNAQVIQVPVDASMAPNVFVSVFVVRGAEASPRMHKSPDYKVGFAELRVLDARSRLKVAVAPGQPSYRPGDQGSAGATVTDGLGQPVAGAEVTFWAADDGVLSLPGKYAAPDLWSEFHRTQPLAVITGTSLMHLLAEDPAVLEFTNKGYMIGGGDGGAGAESDRLRRNFQPVAFFHGSLTTDAAGRVNVPFTVPDNLTRFRLIAVVSSGPDSFGTAESSFEVNKPLMLEPSLPRFANVGDEVTVKGILLNTTDQAFEVEVSLAVDDHADSKLPLVQKVALTPHGSEAVAFPLTFKEAGTAVWQWKAVSTTAGVTLSDNVQSTLQVGYAQPILKEMVYGTLAKTGEPVNFLAGVSPELLQGRGQVTVSISNNALVESAGALAHLLHYPYGCVEQTTSSTLPWLAMHALGDAFPWTRKTPAEIQAAIQKGVDRLLSMQTSGGGLAYWPGGTHPEVWASTYGGMGLGLARQAGARVPEPRLALLAAYLSEKLRRAAEADQIGDLYDRAFTCYTLALLGKAEPAYHEVLSRKVNRLTHPARALLALAILESGGDRAQAIKVLDDPMDPNLEAWNDNLFNSQLTALNMLAWVKIDPAHPVTRALGERLLKERDAQGHWGSTYTNAWALLALAADAKADTAELQATTLEVAFADQKAPLSLPAQSATRTVTLPFNAQPSARTLTVSGTPSGRGRIAITIEARPQLVPVQPRTQGYAISRTYSKVGPDGATTPAENLEVGDLVAVTLTMDIPDPRRYIAVDDPLPSILEAINPKFASQAQTAAAAPAVNRDLIHSWWSNHEELRHDRALFFADNLWSGGKYRLSYLTRVVAEGVVTAPPAKIEAMYEPERYGLSGTQRLSARAAAGRVAGKK